MEAPAPSVRVSADESRGREFTRISAPTIHASGTVGCGRRGAGGRMAAAERNRPDVAFGSMTVPDPEERLPEPMIAAELALMDGWERSGPAITRTYGFRGFRGAVAFANRVAEAAHAANHHPDIHIESYRYVRVVLTTHVSGGVSRADLDLARAIDAALGPLPDRNSSGAPTCEERSGPA